MNSFTIQHQDKTHTFNCDPNLATLEVTLASFGLLPPFSMKYLDDENDLCSISSQLELEFAINHCSPPLRLLLEFPQPAQSLAFNAAPLTDIKVNTDNEKDETTGRKKYNKFDGEEKQNALARKAARLQAINTSLAKANLDPAKAEKLKKQKAKLEQRMAPKQERAPRGRRGGQKRKDRGNPLQRVEELLAEPGISEKRTKKLNDRKAKVETRMQKRRDREGKVATRRANRLEKIQKQLENPNLNEKRRKNLGLKEEKIQVAESKEMENIFQNLTIQ